MTGFTDKCLLLFPSADAWEYKTEFYYTRFNKSVGNLVKYISYCGMELYCLTSDEVAIITRPAGAKFVQTMNDGDSFFMREHNENMKIPSYITIEKRPELYRGSEVKTPLRRGLTPDQRFEDILKRERFISKSVIQEFKAVFRIDQSKNVNYRVDSKENDGRILVNISSKDFIPTCYMSGKVWDCNDILGINGANNPVYKWEVPCLR